MIKILFALTIVLEVVFVPIFLKYYWPTKCKQSMIFKVLSSTMFVLCGFLAIKVSGNSSDYAYMILWGLIMGWVGDVCLHSLSNKMWHFAIGVVAFLAGHIFYIIGLQKAIDTDFPAEPTFAWHEYVFIFVVVTSVVTFLAIKGLFKKNGVIGVGLVVYGIVLSTMLAKALRYAIAVIGYGESNDMFMIALTVGIGSILFAISDITLGYILSTDDIKRAMRIFNIITYYVAQILLAVSIFYVKSREFY